MKQRLAFGSVLLLAVALEAIGSTVEVEGGKREPAARRVRVPGWRQEYRLIHRVDPDYPEPARQARIEGHVRLEAVINADGSIQQLRILSGHPLLAQAARDAVRRWRYKPLRVGGQPVEALTYIEVLFRLPGKSRPPSAFIAPP